MHRFGRIRREFVHSIVECPAASYTLNTHVGCGSKRCTTKEEPTPPAVSCTVFLWFPCTASPTHSSLFLRIRSIFNYTNFTDVGAQPYGASGLFLEILRYSSISIYTRWITLFFIVLVPNILIYSINVSRETVCVKD